MRNMVPLAVSDHFVDINEMVDEVRLAILHPRSSIFVSNPPSPVTCHVSPQRSAFLTHSLDRRKILLHRISHVRPKAFYEACRVRLKAFYADSRDAPKAEG
jgi:hypothetical protein